MRFSVVIPVYNVAPYLRECLDSLRAQTFADWEAVCIDDGSTDGCAAILDEYAARDSRFAVIHQTNAGVSAARNRGLTEAHGEWVTFLDGDDLYVVNWLEEASRILNKENPGILRMREVRFRGRQPLVNEVAEPCGYHVLDNMSSIMEWGWSLIEYDRSVWTMFQRREDACRHPFPVGVSYCEDAARNLLTLPDLEKVCVSEFRGYFYRIHENSSRAQKLSVDERLRFFESCEALLPLDGHRRQFAHYAWEGVLAWIAWHRRDEWPRRGEIRLKFNELMKRAEVGATCMKWHWRVQYLAYAHIGLTWPVLLSQRLLKLIKPVSSCEKDFVR